MVDKLLKICYNIKRSLRKIVSDELCTVLIEPISILTRLSCLCTADFQMRKDFGDIYFKLGYNLLRFTLQLIS